MRWYAEEFAHSPKRTPENYMKGAKYLAIDLGCSEIPFDITGLLKEYWRYITGKKNYYISDGTIARCCESALKEYIPHQSEIPRNKRLCEFYRLWNIILQAMPTERLKR